jgi:hypothetical protein
LIVRSIHDRLNFRVAGRETSTKMTFGQGEHHCVGAHSRTSKPRSASRCSSAAWAVSPFDGDKNTFERTIGDVLRGIKRLHLTFTAVS